MNIRYRLFLLGTVTSLTALLAGNPFCVSLLAAGKMRVQRNIEYLNRSQDIFKETALDIYAPADGKDCHPVVIWVHGGAWKLGSKGDVHLKPAAFTQAGYVLVSINYRLHPRADVAGQAGDVAAAINWVKNNIAQYSGDPQRISLMGHSAGAHLCALIGTDEQYLKQQKLSFADLQGIILLDGACYDVAQHINDIPERFFKSLFVSVFTSDVKKQRAVSPTLQITPQNKMPAFLIIYIAERNDSKKQSRSLAAAIKQAGGSAEVHAARGENHATLNLSLGMPTKPATKWVFDFLEAVSSDTASPADK